jgi:hypothetical protein
MSRPTKLRVMLVVTVFQFSLCPRWNTVEVNLYQSLETPLKHSFISYFPVFSHFLLQSFQRSENSVVFSIVTRTTKHKAEDYIASITIIWRTS